MIKTEQQIAQMRAAGLLVWQAHQVAAELARPGVTTAAIDAAVEAFLLAQGAAPLFKGVPGVVPFPATTCISVNDEVVHGIPGSRQLREGDIVSVDIGCRLDGWCADPAQTHAVGKIAPENQHLLAVTEGALRLALRLMHPGKRWSQIARRMDDYVRDGGCAMLEQSSGLAGHGIGRALWEDPSVPNTTSKRFERSADFVLRPGMVIAVEPMVNRGGPAVRQQPDHWTIATDDGMPSAHFEHTIAITMTGIAVMTAGPAGQGWAIG